MAPMQQMIALNKLLKNVFCTHKHLYRLMNNVDGPRRMKHDKFEADLSLASSRALESSLWELKDLRECWWTGVPDRLTILTESELPNLRVQTILDEAVMRAVLRRLSQDGRFTLQTQFWVPDRSPFEDFQKR